MYGAYGVFNFNSLVNKTVWVRVGMKLVKGILLDFDATFATVKVRYDKKDGNLDINIKVKLKDIFVK